jgi:hypothetical protein
MKYKLNCYGWEAEFIGKVLTNEQVQQIKDLREEKGVDELWEIRFDLEELGIEIWDGDLFHLSKPLHNGTMCFEVEDENGEIVLKFGIEDTSDIYEVIEDFDEYNSHEAFPEENKNIFITIDESKGGLFYCEFESDELPTPADFACSSGSVDTPDGDWDFVDSVFFKGNKLEVTDYLDNWGKAATVEIYEHEE